jgi:hypothetical protein
MCGIMEDYGGKFKPTVITCNNVRTTGVIAERKQGAILDLNQYGRQAHLFNTFGSNISTDGIRPYISFALWGSRTGLQPMLTENIV